MKGSVLGRRFEYTVKRPDDWCERDEWEHYIKRLQDMSNWCSEQKIDHWGQEGHTFWFFYEEDYMMFMLRWA